MMELPLFIERILHPVELYAVRIDNPLQAFLVPYIGYIHLFYWVSYYGIIAYLATRFIFLPLYRKHAAAQKDAPKNG